MERVFKTGCKIVFIDEHRRAHDALVTCWHHNEPEGRTFNEVVQEARDKGVKDPQNYMPCINLVFVSENADKHDPYGRQIERHSSVSYGRSQHPRPFLGMCWAWPDEEEEAVELASQAMAAGL